MHYRWCRVFRQHLHWQLWDWFRSWIVNQLWNSKRLGKTMPKYVYKLFLSDMVELFTWVIDVGTRNSIQSRLLVYSLGMKGDFVAFSYCWSENVFSLLITETLGHFQRAFYMINYCSIFGMWSRLPRSLKYVTCG